MNQEVQHRLTKSTEFWRELEERANAHADKEARKQAAERMERRELEQREDVAYLIVFGIVTVGIMIALAYKLWSMM